MHSGMIASSPASEIVVLARAKFGIVLLVCAAVPAVRRMLSSLRTWPESNYSLDLDELWERCRQGQTSWDEYLRYKIGGARGLAWTNTEPSSNSTPYNAAS